MADDFGRDVKPTEHDDAPRDRQRSRSRSRSPPPRRRSPSPRRRSPSPRRSRSPAARRMDTDDREPNRARSRSRERSRSRSRDRSERDDRRSEPQHGHGHGHGHGYGRGGGGAHRGGPVNPMHKAMSREVAANEAAKRSRKDCRVYVGNLAFGVKWNDLKDFMREAGNVVFSEILLLPNGMSKGCGVVEFSQPEEAQRAIRELNDQQLLGRPVFIREDREESAKYGAAAISGRAGYMGPGAFAGRGGFGGGFGGRGGFGGAAPGFGGPVGGGSGRHLYVQGLPFTVGWQDLKDLFRAAGSIIRADVKMNPDGSHSGTGTVIYETPQDAQTAIDMYNGFTLDVGGQQSVLEVRHDRFPLAFAGGARGGFGGARGGFGGGFGGRGGFGGAAAFGGMAPGFGAPGAYGAYGAAAAAGGFGGGGFGAAPGMGPGAFAGLPTGPAAGVGNMLPPSHQLFVRNLPWSTSNEDLVELFATCGTVNNAEVLFEHGRSKGSGVVELGSVDEATTAKERFNGYLYGGRPLAIDYNQRPHAFTAVAPVADYGEAGMDGAAPL